MSYQSYIKPENPKFRQTFLDRTVCLILPSFLIFFSLLLIFCSALSSPVSFDAHDIADEMLDDETFQLWEDGWWALWDFFMWDVPLLRWDLSNDWVNTPFRNSAILLRSIQYWHETKHAKTCLRNTQKSRDVHDVRFKQIWRKLAGVIIFFKNVFHSRFPCCYNLSVSSINAENYEVCLSTVQSCPVMMSNPNLKKEIFSLPIFSTQEIYQIYWKPFILGRLVCYWGLCMLLFSQRKGARRVKSFLLFNGYIIGNILSFRLSPRCLFWVFLSSSWNF